MAQKSSNLIFAPRSEWNVRLTHGVMVALQILVLSVKVRILIGQQKSSRFIYGWLFYFQSCSVKVPCLRDAVRQGILMGQQKVITIYLRMAFYFQSCSAKVPCLRDAVRQGILMGQQKSSRFIYGWLFYLTLLYSSSVTLSNHTTIPFCVLGLTAI